MALEAAGGNGAFAVVVGGALEVIRWFILGIWEEETA